MTEEYELTEARKAAFRRERAKIQRNLEAWRALFRKHQDKL
ncbi:MAG: hypothetical protein ACYDDF_06190 [Thermoplasmatota archaeon]